MDHDAGRGSIRTLLVAVRDLARSVEFYRDVFDVEILLHEDQLAVLGGQSAHSHRFVLRQTGSNATRHGQQELGIRGLVLDVGSTAELSRVEARLRAHGLFRDRRHLPEEEAWELVHGHDPDALPLVFVASDAVGELPPEHYRHVASLMYSLDM